MPEPTPSGRVAVPASSYSFAELVEIYNQTRIDYIVPMPMNARRMQEYIEHYNINTDASIVVVDQRGEPLGLGMLGVRGHRTWITRLGVNPNRRERRLGSYLMTHMIENSQQYGAKTIQLEVIIGNDPALNLFLKYGFQPTRELLVVRRPPKPPPEGTQPLIQQLDELSDEEIVACLNQREPGASWVEETPSLLQAGSLKGIRIEMAGSEGWAVFMCTRFQVEHIVIGASGPNYNELAFALLYYIHSLYPNRDTKVENIPTEHPIWQAYQRHGYVISFRRTEMLLHLP